MVHKIIEAAIWLPLSLYDGYILYLKKIHILQPSRCFYRPKIVLAYYLFQKCSI